jgi:hypothetical protein
LRVFILLTEGNKPAGGPAYSFPGAEGRVHWPMELGEGLGRAGAFNAFLRMGFLPELASPASLPLPGPNDLVLVCASGGLNEAETTALERWMGAGGVVVASGISAAWARFLAGATLESRRETNPHAGMAYLLEGRTAELVAPPRWPFFHLKSAAAADLVRVGCVATIHGERQTPSRALVTAHPESPAAIRSGQFVLLNGSPFAAFQAWLQGQEDLEPWLAWRHRLFWLDELVAFLREVLVRCKALPQQPSGPGIAGLGETTVVLRHDLDHSRDTTYLELEDTANVPGVHAILKDRNTAFWREKLRASSAHESAFHYNTAHFSRMGNILRREVLRLAPKPYLPAKSAIAGNGLLRQVRWAKRTGIGTETLHRHLSFIYYPEYIDALDAVFRNEPVVLGGSSFCRGQVLRWGVDRADGARGSYADFPDAQFPYWFPFRLAHAGDGGRLLRGWETASLMEVEPGMLEQWLNYRIAGLPQRVLVLNYHPAHANRSNFTEGGCVVWFREVLDLLRSSGVKVMTMRDVFETFDLAVTRKQGVHEAT